MYCFEQMTHFFKSTEKFYNCILAFWSKKSNFSDFGKASSSNLQVDQIIWRRLVHIHRLYLQFSLYPVTYRVEWVKDICVLCHAGRNCPAVCPCPWWAPGFTQGPRAWLEDSTRTFLPGREGHLGKISLAYAFFPLLVIFHIVFQEYAHARHQAGC